MVTRTLGVGVACLFALALGGGCSGITDSTGEHTYKSVWINAAWSGGRIGTPLTVKAITPNDYTGSLCPATAIVLENHNDGILNDAVVIRNNCSIPIEVGYCASAGALPGSGGLSGCFPDVLKTPENFIKVSYVGAGARTYLGTSPLNLDLNVFYCSDDSDLNLGRVKGVAALECVQR